MKTQLPRLAKYGPAYVLLLAFTLAGSGCLAVAAGAAGGAALGYAYLQGRVYENYNASFNDTWQATEAGLRELGMPVVSRERKESSGYIETRTSEADTVRIYLAAVPGSIPAEPTVTRVSVRVATFGDKPVSNRILGQVDLHLAPATAPKAVVASQPPAPAVMQTAAPPQAALPQPPSPVVTQQTPPPPLSADGVSRK